MPLQNAMEPATTRCVDGRWWLDPAPRVASVSPVVGRVAIVAGLSARFEPMVLIGKRQPGGVRQARAIRATLPQAISLSVQN